MFFWKRQSVLSGSLAQLTSGSIFGCDIQWIDETQYRAVGAKEYSFSKPAFDIWVFLVKHYNDFKDYNEQFSSKKEKQKINQFVLDIMAFKEQMEEYLRKKDKDEVDKLQKEEKLVYQEYQQLSDGDFKNVYLLFNDIYYSSLQHSDRIVAKLKMNYMEQVNKEIDRVLKQIYDVSEPDDITKRAELYIVDVKSNFTLFAHFLFTLLLKICFSYFSYDDFPHLLYHE
ncbi:hypothetical protein [Ureibacillus endophyticus]|uniref:hypothetical protein n=1 Tax=Ureibacillus endophyticus TaxID=1978490 RepID=UPI0011C3F4A6|nr:hypothetical protein [Lysinibacillus endophyticus]